MSNIWKFLRGLVAEDDSASLGRIGLWLVLVPAIYVWLYKTQDIWIYHFYTIVIFLMYNFSKKIPLFIELLKAWKGNNVEKPTNEL